MRKKLIHAGLGFLAGAVASKAVKTKCFKDLAVDAVAEGMKVKDGFDKTVENVRVSTNDIFAEARIKKEEDLKKREEEKRQNDISNIACCEEECSCEEESDETCEDELKEVKE